MRKALIVGIDYYEHFNSLRGCVNDAHEMKSVLERNSDGSVNFDVKLLTGTGSAAPVSRVELKANVQDLFRGDSDIALLYFAGHGHVEATGGYLVTSEVNQPDEGFALNDILTLANRSQAKNKVIILDSCHSGVAGNLDAGSKVAGLAEGLTILTAAEADHYAAEKDGSGVFTTLLVDALRGAAANLVGDVTPGSAYAHIDQSLGPWAQPPLFKTSVKSFIPLRRAHPPIPHGELRQITEFFPHAGAEFKLDPSFEPERGIGQDDLPAPDPANTARFAILQRYNRVNLVVPVGAPHMWHAAINSKSCRLTVLGEHYRRLVVNRRF